ncbi:18703_t:CDS:1, partial [Gigaspora rosea]
IESNENGIMQEANSTAKNFFWSVKKMYRSKAVEKFINKTFATYLISSILLKLRGFEDPPYYAVHSYQECCQCDAVFQVDFLGLKGLIPTWSK